MRTQFKVLITIAAVGLMVGCVVAVIAVRRKNIAVSQRGSKGQEERVIDVAAPSIDKTIEVETSNEMREFLSSRQSLVPSVEEDLVYDVELTMTARQKEERGLPAEGVIKYKWVRPINLSAAPLLVITQSPPPSPDTDQDGLADDVEGRFGTNPSERDTDKDGIGDGEEVQAKRDPLDSAN